MFLTAVRLSDNSFGTSSTIADEQLFCPKSNRDFGNFSPLNIRGKKVLDILETKKETGILSSLRIAVLNALSSKIISSGNYRIIEDLDPIQLVDLGSHKTITIVGAFHSYIRKISDTANKLFAQVFCLHGLPSQLVSDRDKLFTSKFFAQLMRILNVKQVIYGDELST